MKLILQSIRQTILWTVIAGIIYPLVMTLFAQVAFPDQANGSLVLRDGKVVGSSLLAQQFTGDKYFWPRPSANTYGISANITGNSLAASSGSNLGPTSAQLQTNVQTAAAALRKASKLPDDAPVPADLVFASASGLDPHISPGAARFQIGRVAAARGLPEDQVKALVEQFVEKPQYGFFGEERVNVLLLNLALDDKWPATKPAITPPPAPAAATPAAAAPAAAAPAAAAPASTAAAPAATATSATTSTPATAPAAATTTDKTP